MHCKERKTVSGKRLHLVRMNRRATSRKNGQLYDVACGFSAQKCLFENARTEKTHIAESRGGISGLRCLPRFFAPQCIKKPNGAMRRQALPNDKTQNIGDRARSGRRPIPVWFRKCRANRANADRYPLCPAKRPSNMHDADKTARAVRRQVCRMPKAPPQCSPGNAPSRMQKHIPKPKWYILSLISLKANLQTVRRKKRSVRCAPDRQTAKT